jgi:RNA polymerase sigma factor (sigma-70 family)
MEAIVKAWSHRRSLEKEENFKAWMLRILTNSFLSHCRKRSLRPATEPWDDDSETHFSLFDKLHQPFLLWWSNPEREFMNTLLRKDLERAVDELPEVFRVIVVLSDVGGLSYQDIARVLAIPMTFVHVYREDAAYYKRRYGSTGKKPGSRKPGGHQKRCDGTHPRDRMPSSPRASVQLWMNSCGPFRDARWRTIWASVAPVRRGSTSNGD